jgi:hypothetical protein
MFSRKNSIGLNSFKQKIAARFEKVVNSNFDLELDTLGVGSIICPNLAATSGKV